MTEARYLAVMLGDSLLARLTEVGLLSDAPSASELLDLQVDTEYERPRWHATVCM